MKKLLLLLVLPILVTGCVTFHSIEEYDSDGKIIKKITEERDPISKLMDEMEKKDIAWWRCGWFVVCEITLTSTETYLPIIRFAGGKANRGHISLTPGSKQDMAKCIEAMQTPIDIKVTTKGVGISEENKDGP